MAAVEIIYVCLKQFGYKFSSEEQLSEEASHTIDAALLYDFL